MSCKKLTERQFVELCVGEGLFISEAYSLYDNLVSLKKAKKCGDLDQAERIHIDLKRLSENINVNESKVVYMNVDNGFFTRSYEGRIMLKGGVFYKV